MAKNKPTLEYETPPQNDRQTNPGPWQAQYLAFPILLALVASLAALLVLATVIFRRL